MDTFSILPAPDVCWAVLATATVAGAGLVEPLRAALALLIAAPLILALDHAGRPLASGFVLLALAAAGWGAAEAWAAATGLVDDPRIVIDEVVGLLAGAVLAGRLGAARLALLAAAFLALDRLKPWPIGAIEPLPGAWGVMGDDLAVGAVLGLGLAMIRQPRGRGGSKPDAKE
jgi:phosphatidylglycerophosphatase A